MSSTAGKSPRKRIGPAVASAAKSFVQATAVVLFLQGLLALAGLPYLNTVGKIILLLITAAYVLLAVGLWYGPSWVALPGMVLTLPQLALVSTWPFSWACFVGATFGVHVVFVPNDARLYPGIFYSLGVQFVESHAGNSRALVSMLTPGSPKPFWASTWWPCTCLRYWSSAGASANCVPTQASRSRRRAPLEYDKPRARLIRARGGVAAETARNDQALGRTPTPQRDDARAYSAKA